MNIPDFGSIPSQYSATWFSQFTQRLRTTFRQLNTFQPVLAGALLTPEDGKFATDADFADLRPGQVYIDTTAGNVLKVKP